MSKNSGGNSGGRAPGFWGGSLLNGVGKFFGRASEGLWKVGRKKR